MLRGIQIEIRQRKLQTVNTKLFTEVFTESMIKIIVCWSWNKVLHMIRWNNRFGKTEWKLYGVIFLDIIVQFCILLEFIRFCKSIFLSGYLAGFVSQTWQPCASPPYEFFVFLPLRAHACVPPVCLTCLCQGVAILVLAWLTSAEYHSQISQRYIQRARICVLFLFLLFPPQWQQCWNLIKSVLFLSE